MAERNLLGEGFVYNTLAPDGSVSGTQVVSIPEINTLVDGNFTTTALMVTGTLFTSLDADLGARWKLDRIELYTNESSDSNFAMYVSTNNEDFYPITMTGSAGLWVGSVSGTTVSGAPRYLRYEHTPPADRLVQEWRAINDDTLVDFGSDGSQTSVTIDDAPVGKPSEQITTLPLYNRFSTVAQGAVFIDDTGDRGDDNVEISTSPTGPWFGRQTQASRQPDITPWYETDAFGAAAGDVYEGASSILVGIRTVSGTAYLTDFSGNLANGWSTTGFSSSSAIGGAFRGNTSTSVTPSFQLDNDFGNDPASSPDSVPAISNDFTPFRAEDYDTVKVVLRTPTLTASDLVEGPRLFWRDHTTEDYNAARSTLSTTPGANFTGASQNFTFNVGQVPTWSGAIRSFKVQNYTTVTGVGITSYLESLEAYYSDGGERLALALDSVISGTFPGINGGSATNVSEYQTVINTEHPVKEPCIITSVSAKVRPNSAVDAAGWFLVRFANGFSYNDRADEVNAFGSPFEVVYFIAADESHSSPTTTTSNQVMVVRQPVLWQAEPGDMIGYAYRTDPLFGGSRFAYDTNLTTTSGGCLTSTTKIGIQDSQTNAGLSTDLNTISNWATSGRRINIQFNAISAGRYVANGAYTTPIFDGGSDPALLSVSYTAVEDNGTSIDVSGSAAFDTLEARASAVPANTATDLGRRRSEFALGAHPSDSPAATDPRYTSNYVIGIFNAEVGTRENSTGPDGDTSIENVAMSLFYHETKQELWFINLLISGTLSTDMRPVWDAYDLENGEYLRTQGVTGNITYYHNNDGHGSTEPNVFEPAGWVADYDREEIYIISRENEFSVGAGTYNGLILDLDGNFKDVFWRNDHLLQDIVDAGIEVDTSNANKHLRNMRTVAYRAPYFYSITSDENPGSSTSDEGLLLEIYRLGNNPLDPENDNDVEFITSINIPDIPGLGFVSSSRPVQTFTYCKANDLFYFTVRSDTEIHTMSISRIGSPPTETFVASQGPISEATVDQIAVSSQLSNGFGFGPIGAGNNWNGAGDYQQLLFFEDWAYVPDRDSFVLLFVFSSNRSRDLVREGEFSSDYFLFRHHNHNMMVELAAETQGSSAITPKTSSLKDPLWGVLSGTLSYDQIQSDSILFPTGRYAQLRYTFNSDPGQAYTPYLRASSLTQGIRVSDIPPAGTKNIYLRTNIPEDEPTGDQSGRLKVYWELRAT